MIEAPQVPTTLLELLRCPIAVKNKGQEDPGRLTVKHDGWWLVCEDNGYKYPVRPNGVPNMVASIGAQFAATAIDDLPVPPPADLDD